jgi:hypothetical protein
MGQIAGEIWINQSDSYSNFALLLIAGWAFVVGVGAGLELPAATLAIAIGAAQSLVRAVL